MPARKVGLRLERKGMLQQAGRTDPKLNRAAKLLEWLQSQPDGKASFREMLQLGPSPVRTKAAAEEALAILVAHGWTVEVSSSSRRTARIAPACREFRDSSRVLTNAPELQARGCALRAGGAWDE